MKSNTINKLLVKRTGNVYSIASSEYMAEFPDGTLFKFWSPPWNDYDEADEDLHALEYAEKIWKKVEKGLS